MKLFRKKLNSVAELRREKLKLQFMRSHTTSDALMPPIKELKRKSKKSSGGSNPIQTIMDVAGAKGPMQTALALAGPLSKLMGFGSKKNLLRKVAVEVIGGYLAYKLVRIAIGMFRSRSKTSKANKAR